MTRYDQRGTKLPVSQIFKDLTDIWQEKTGGYFINLAKEMGVRYQTFSHWRTGCRGVAPWWAILFVCGKLNLAINLRADAITIVQAYKVKYKRKHNELSSDDGQG